MKITHIIAKEIYDCRGLPALSCEIILDQSHTVIASVPAGTSRSGFEMIDLRDGGERLMGMGVKKAIENIHRIIGPQLIGREPNLVQMDLDLLAIDDSDTKDQLGGNAMLAVSMAVARAHAYVEQVPLFELLARLCNFDTVALPVPAFNLINGGKHALNKVAIQEIMILPIGAQNFHHVMEIGAATHLELERILERRGKSTAVGVEGGFVDFESETEALDMVMEAAQEVQKKYGSTIMVCLDAAASHFYNPKLGMYQLNDTLLDGEELIAWYKLLASQYPVYFIEDGMAETDYAGWQQLYKTFNGTVYLVGDDLFATHVERIAKGVEEQLAHSVIIKPSQIGTITEALQAAMFAHEHGLGVIASHRSGETNDSFISDLAVAVSAQQIKAGGLSRGERMAKYNRLLAIEDLLMQVEEDF